MATKGSLDDLCCHDLLPSFGGGKPVPVFTACLPPPSVIIVAGLKNISRQHWYIFGSFLNPRPFWHYIQVDWEVTAMETAILGVLPGSVEFLTIPWAAWLPLFPCVPWLLWAPCAAWVSWTMVLGPGSGEVSVRTTVDWTRACNKHIKRQIEWKSYLKLFRAEIYIWESASFDSTPCNKRLRRPSIPYFSREQCLMSSISRKLNFPQMKCV